MLAGKKATQQQTDALLMGIPKDLYEILLKYPKYIDSLTLSPSEQARLVNIMLLNTDTGSVASSERECMTSFREANSATPMQEENLKLSPKQRRKKGLAHHAMSVYAKIYQIERKMKSEKRSFEEIKAIRRGKYSLY